MRPPLQLYEQRDFGAKINATFQYLTQHSDSFALSIIYIAGPPILLIVMAGTFLTSALFNASNASVPGFTDSLLPSVGVLLLGLVLSLLAISLTTVAHLKVYAQTNGSPVRVAQVWAEVRSHIWPAVVFNFLSVLLTLLGAFLFLIPGLYLAIVLTLGMPVLMFEDTNFGQTWTRCFRLISDKWWSTFGLLTAMTVIVSLLRLTLQLPATLIGMFIDGSELEQALLGLFVALGAIGWLLLTSLTYIAVGLQYTNLVERQEGRGLHALIETLGTTPTQAPDDDEGDY